MSASARPRSRLRWEPVPAAPVVWLGGDWGRGEFAEALAGQPDLAACRRAKTLDEVVSAGPEQGQAAEYILLAQPRPGCLRQADIDRVLAAAPLTRIVIVAGTWCEGEQRTGRPLVGAERIYWYQLASCWRELLATRTAGARIASIKIRLGQVAIDATDFASFETLAAVLAPYGATCAWTPRGRGQVGGATHGIWDGGQLDGKALAELTAFCSRFAPGPRHVVAVVDFPRAGDFAAVRNAGAQAILAKPYPIGGLLNALQQPQQPTMSAGV